MMQTASANRRNWLTELIWSSSSDTALPLSPLIWLYLPSIPEELRLWQVIVDQGEQRPGRRAGGADRRGGHSERPVQVRAGQGQELQTPIFVYDEPRQDRDPEPVLDVGGAAADVEDLDGDVPVDP